MVLIKDFDTDIKQTSPKIVMVDKEYLTYLHVHDNRVSLKKDRPYVGLSVRINDKVFVIPLTSQTTQERKKRGLKKRNSLTTTFVKAAGIEISDLLHNNMIPVPKMLAQRVDAVFLGICLSVFLFVVLPTLLAGLCSGFVRTPLVRNLFEGLLRIVIFLLYLWGCCHMKDVKRMFAYHGAEHKTIFCYEHGRPLTVENVRQESRFHPRCGTSFLFVVIILSILVFSLVSINLTMWDNVFVRVGLRLLLLPVVVALSYELNRWIGRHDDMLIARATA